MARALLRLRLMRSVDVRSPSFLGGLTVGLALSGVAVLIARASKRRAPRPEPVHHPVIDGAKPIDPVALTVGPPFEGTATVVRLESEIEDVPPVSQRW